VVDGTRRLPSERLAMNRADDPSEVLGSVAFGTHLRSFRRQLRLSLRDVEIGSSHEFKASVLGAYERGDRAMSVSRLQRLARLYRVPVTEIIGFGEQGARRDIDRPVTLDLGAVRGLEDSDGALLARYVRAIEVARGDYNGRVLTIRRSDTTALATIFRCGPHQVPARLDELNVRHLT
jgi:transcriptional regulator with XRE-family HTH domain